MSRTEQPCGGQPRLGRKAGKGTKSNLNDKTKISFCFNKGGKRRKEYANRIRRELVSLRRPKSQKLLFNLPDLSHLGPNLFSSPLQILLLISLFIMGVNYSRDDDSLHRGFLKITFPQKLM